jgi:diguanylate cyclase
MQESTIGLRSALAASTKEIALLREDLAVKSCQAETDSLTGVANRRKLEAEFEAAARIADKTRAPLSLLMVDIDRFKSFNDTYGHQIGDQVLKAVARILVRCVKGGDLVARYGGEEFAIMLPNTDLTGAIAVGNQMRESIARNRIRLKLTGECLRSITLSGGGSQHTPGDRFPDVAARADAALRQSKQEGRNQVRSLDGIAKRTEGPTAA